MGKSFYFALPLWWWWTGDPLASIDWFQSKGQPRVFIVYDRRAFLLWSGILLEHLEGVDLHLGLRRGCDFLEENNDGDRSPASLVIPVLCEFQNASKSNSAECHTLVTPPPPLSLRVPDPNFKMTSLIPECTLHCLDTFRVWPPSLRKHLCIPLQDCKWVKFASLKYCFRLSTRSEWTTGTHCRWAIMACSKRIMAGYDLGQTSSSCQTTRYLWCNSLSRVVCIDCCSLREQRNWRTLALRAVCGENRQGESVSNRPRRANARNIQHRHPPPLQQNHAWEWHCGDLFGQSSAPWSAHNLQNSSCWCWKLRHLLGAARNLYPVYRLGFEKPVAVNAETARRSSAGC